jgi:C4-dicarboxylate-specific signal transduction histidine kinase
MRTHRRKTKSSDRGNILNFDKGVGLDLRNEPQRRAPSQLIEAERMSAIGRIACSISHDMRHSLTAIYANAEFLERADICASVPIMKRRKAEISSNRKVLCPCLP